MSAPARAWRRLRAVQRAVWWSLAAAPTFGAAALTQDAPAAQLQESDGARISRLLDDLEHAGARSAALQALLSLGEPAAARALDGLAEAGLEARRARAALVREAGRAPQIGACAGLLEGDAGEVEDGATRVLLVQFLARPELRGEDAVRRVEVLSERARSDPARDVRAQAIAGLGRIDDASAAAALETLLTELTPPERAQAARALAGHGAARERVLAWVQRALRADAETTSAPEDALVELLGAGYGSALAELPAGGSSAGDLAPFALGLRHPSADVQAAASAALERFVSRLRFLGEVPRADRALAELVRFGVDPDELDAARARLALEAGEDPRVALDAARALGERYRGRADVESLRRASQADLLEAAAAFASDQPAAAEEPLARAAAALDELLSQRLDLRGAQWVTVALDMTERRALVELYRALLLLWNSSDVAHPQVLEHARAAHELSLRSQATVLATWSRVSNAWPPPWSLDSLLSHGLSPWLLVFGNDRHPHVPPARALELEERLCTALATVAPLEMPGFQPVEASAPEVADLRRDPRRTALLSRLLDAFLQALKDLAFRRKAEEQEEATLMLRLRQQIQSEGQRDAGGSWSTHLRQRMPSDAALPLAEELRSEGRTDAAAALAQRMIDDLTRAGDLLQAEWGEELMARAQVALGSSAMDEGRPQEAQELFAKALERLDVLEQGLAARGVNEAGRRPIRLRRADVLVGMAVNANVKLGDPARALECFERAYALREDDFMRVLLACYRARAGRAVEARAVLRELPVSPYNYYNLACTYALLGERALALDFLRRDFGDMRSSPGQLARQKAWARGDPDLQALRGDPAFEALVADDGGASAPSGADEDARKRR